MSRARRVVAASAVLGAATVFSVLPLCDLLFACGCTWPWAGGLRHCNIHDASGPHCPWCVYPASADLSLATLLVAQAAGAWAVARSRSSFAWLLAGGAAAGGAAAVLVRGAVAWWAGYPL